MSTAMHRRSLCRLSITVALCALLQACGGAAYPREGARSAGQASEPVACDDDATTCERELRAREVELDGVLARLGAEAGPVQQASRAPDCASARDLRDRICELSAAICELAARNAASAELQSRCASAQTGCTQAREDVAGSCGP
jgi:hypothetical protein